MCLWRLPWRELLWRVGTNCRLHRLRPPRRVRKVQQQLLFGPKGVLCNDVHKNSNNKNINVVHADHLHHHHHNNNVNKHHSFRAVGASLLWSATIKLQLFVHAPEIPQQYLRPRVQQLRLPVRRSMLHGGRGSTGLGRSRSFYKTLKYAQY